MDKIKVETDLFLNLDGNINNPESMIKCEEVEGPASDVVVKQEYDCYNDGTVVNDGNMELTQGASIDARAFVERLLNDNVNRGSTDLESKGHECINEEIMAYEQNHQVSSKVKQEKEFQEDTILKKEIEFVDVQETNDTVGHCLYKEKRIWNNDTGRFDQCLQKLASQPSSCEDGTVEAIHSAKELHSSSFNDHTSRGNGNEMKSVKNESVKAEASHFEESFPVINTFECDVVDFGASGESELHSCAEIEHYVKKYRCHLCHYRATKKDYIRSHIDTVHLNVNKFKCSSCDYRSSKLNNVKSHMKAVHLQSKNFKCHMCDFATSRKQVLKRHVEGIHSKLKTYKCSICDYRSTSKTNIDSHLVQVQICGYASQKKSDLTLHVDAVHLKLKNFKCPMCPFASSRKSGLVRHVEAIHSKQKNYICNFCDYQAYSKCNFKVHVDRVHSSSSAVHI